MAYLVDLSRTAEAEMLEAFVWKGERSVPAANEWYNGLMAALASLEENPKRCPTAPDQDAFPEEVHQFLYGRRRDVYRILFSVRGVTVYVLHIRHGSQKPFSATDEAEDADAG